MLSNLGHSPFNLIKRPSNVWINKSIVAWDVWHVTPSCWNKTSFTSITSRGGTKKKEKLVSWCDRSLHWPSSFSKKYGPTISPLYKPDQTVTRNRCIGFCKTTCRFIKRSFIRKDDFFLQNRHRRAVSHWTHIHTSLVITTHQSGLRSSFLHHLCCVR